MTERVSKEAFVTHHEMFYERGKTSKSDFRFIFIVFHAISVTRFGKSLQVFGKFLMLYFLLGKMLSLLWQFVTLLG